MKIDLKQVLDLAQERGGTVATLEEVADWAIKFDNFSRLLTKIKSMGGRINMDEALLVRYVALVGEMFEHLLGYAISMTVKAGESTVVETDASSSNLPVEIALITEKPDLTTEIKNDIKVKPEFN